MKKLDYEVKGKDIILHQPDFDLDETLDCGQAFRWVRNGDAYSGFALDTPLTVSGKDGRFVFYDTNEETFLNLWAEYLDLYTDYSEIKKRLSQDETLACACEFAPGIRLIKQDSWEALCSFIISQNNNIPRIKGIISRLCEHYGHFPSYGELANETPQSLAFLRAGFRAKYLVDAAQKLFNKQIDLDVLKTAPIDEARRSLMTITGVGPKVAECALLYGMYRTEVFPVDVWIKRVMENYYPDGLPECTKGIEGIAQQYLFHYIRHLDNS